ncbi:MAG: hypothetical protein KKC20_25755 [Proteobacteria bacterium]|nr:hypothetical protein [Pseudomonadota bacterium]
MKFRKKAGCVIVLMILLFSQWAICAEVETIKGETDWMNVDPGSKKIVFSATVTKNSSKSAVTDWGQRGQAWIGCKGGSQEAFFIFTTDVPRLKIDEAIRKMGVKYSNQISKENWKAHRELKETTTPKDFLDGDSAIVSLKFEKNGETVQVPMETLIEEKIEINNKEVLRPHTPHYVYHGTGEAIQYPSGCIVCPSDCFGGIITDNRLPVLTYDSWYRVNWNLMPAVGSKVQVIIQFTAL